MNSFCAQFLLYCYPTLVGWLSGIERRSLIGELSLVCIGPAADG